MLLKVTGLLLLLVAGCGDACYYNGFTNITNYDINPSIMLSCGARVDPSEFEVDTETLNDRLISISECLQEVNGDMLQLRFHCIVIKVVSPVKGCHDWQLIDVPAPNNLCEEKGIHPTDECPCMWRTALQNDNVIITPPDIYLWEVVRMHTGIDNIWNTPFSKCGLL